MDYAPFINKNGWLTEFYLTLSTTPRSIPFTINHTAFATGPGRTTTQRLGYTGNYEIEMPINCPMQEGTRAVFVRWGDGLASNTRTMYLSSNQTLSAQYKILYLVSINASVGGAVNLGGGWFDEGTTMILNATPSPGYRLVGFTTVESVSLLSQNGSSVTVMVNGPGSVTANFIAIPPDYTCLYIAAAVVAIATVTLALFLRIKRKGRSSH
jgi:hypothetical protein